VVQDLREQGATAVDAGELLLLAKALLTSEAEAIETQMPDSAAKANSLVDLDASFEAEAEEPVVIGFSSSGTKTKPVQPVPFTAEAVDRINLELLAVFLEETQDIIPQMGGKLRAWRMLPQDEDIHHALLRCCIP
jgi:chemosensory pili system protein ChpA (sensor histidine kinase/response regulator)